MVCCSHNNLDLPDENNEDGDHRDDQDEGDDGDGAHQDQQMLHFIHGHGVVLVGVEAVLKGAQQRSLRH